VMLLSEGQMSDYKCAALMLPALPKAKELLADKGYDADWFRAASLNAASPPVSPLIQSKGRDPVRRPPLQTAPQNRKHVRTAQRLAAHPCPLRPLRPTHFSAICVAAGVAFWL
jgi:hypothetical protein